MQKPGFYRDVPAHEYHSGPEISKSGLDIIAKRPALYRKAVDERAAGTHDDKGTKAQRRGTDLHALALEPERFAEDYALPFVAPSGALRTIEDMKSALAAAGVEFKAASRKDVFETLCRENGLPLYSDAYAEYLAENDGKVIITREQWDQAHSMGAAVMAHPEARALLTAPGASELSAYAKCPHTGLMRRVRADRLRRDGFCVDVKTCPSVEDEDFQNSIARYRYHVSHAFYLDTLQLAFDQSGGFEDFERPKAFVILAVADDACVINGEPYGVAVFRIEPEDVEIGRAEYTHDMKTLQKCVAENVWPGATRGVQSIRLPAWHRSRALARAAA